MQIFYSWQSDLPAETHKNYLLSRLTECIATVNDEIEINASMRPEEYIELDHDTKGAPGSPDIFNTIVQKINQSDLFIADLSLVGQTFARDNQKKLPNANVLIELGYALCALGSDRILLLLDGDSGTPSELPFDLRHKRIILFHSQQIKDEKERKRFTDELTNEISIALAVYGKHLTKRDLQQQPSFNDIMHIIMQSDSHDDWELACKERVYPWYYKHNVNLRFVINYDTNAHRDDFKEKWANQFPDPHASSYYTDLYFNSTCLGHYLLVSVDGARAVLPIPDLRDLSISALQYQIAKIHDEQNSLNEYIRRAGLHVKVAQQLGQRSSL